MTYRSFLQEVATAQLREGRDGLRLVGLGLLVPDVQWSSNEEWEEVGGNLPMPASHAQYAAASCQECHGLMLDGAPAAPDPSATPAAEPTAAAATPTPATTPAP